MIILILFSFLAGLVTILSPCILPILPIVLTGSLGGGKSRPYGVVTGFVASFTFFTLFLSTLVRILGISADILRSISIIVILVFGLSLVLPGFQGIVEKLFSGLASRTPTSSGNGFGGGLVLGLSLGLLWTPCVGPILASVISLSLTGSITLSTFAIILAYSLGTALPMLLIIHSGRSLLQRHPWLLQNSAKIQRGFGVLMLLVAIGIYFNFDRKFQAFILDKFPSYGTGLTQLEDNTLVQNLLDNLGPTSKLENIGKPMAPELIPGGQWFNSAPLKLSELRGKVVLIDFWTYTCINCIRTLPYLRDWHAKYASQGLVIIGVHTPEFEFEKNPENVKKAITDFKLEYPIMQDNDYATWRAYNNRYWPAKYFIDKDGKIRSTHFGEGDYDESENIIQELLAATGATISFPVSNPSYQITSRTPELYLGSLRSVPGYYVQTGDWKTFPEYSQTTSDSKLTLQFESKDVFLVMRPASPTGGTGQVKVFLDDELINTVTVDSDRLYDLVKLDSPGKHTLRLEFSGSPLQLFAFTFG